MTREDNLIQLGRIYSTDKVSHGYLSEYAKYLPEQVYSLLEIGAAKGASLQMWRDFFSDCDIHVIDLFQDPDHVTVKWCREHLFQPHKGDQASLPFLVNIRDQFQVILDDGSHRADHMLISFKHLFHNNLESGGVYAIEDCHLNHDPYYFAGEVNRFEETPLWMFKHYKETGEIVNPYFNEGEQAMFKNLVSRVEMVANDKLILIWRA